MGKSKRQRKTANWVGKQNCDHFVQQARAAGWRARAIFKLEEIDNKYHLIKSETRLVDLGCAPGSWSQYAIAKVQHPRQIVALDLLSMESIPGINFIQGDFTDLKVIDAAKRALGDNLADLVLSDMTANITGISATDQARAELIQQSILLFCGQALRPGGVLLTKLFEGEAAMFMRNQMKTLFQQFQAIKPDASRAESKEIFLLARGYQGRHTEN